MKIKNKIEIDLDPACRECGSDMNTRSIEFGEVVGKVVFACKNCNSMFEYTEDEKGIISTKWYFEE